MLARRKGGSLVEARIPQQFISGRMLGGDARLAHVDLYGRLPMARISWGDDRQMRLQVYIRPVCADRSLRALMDSADPHLISPESSKLGFTFRLSGSRSDLSTITTCSPCATFSVPPYVVELIHRGSALSDRTGDRTGRGSPQSSGPRSRKWGLPDARLPYER